MNRCGRMSQWKNACTSHFSKGIDFVLYDVEGYFDASTNREDRLEMFMAIFISGGLLQMFDILYNVLH